MENSKKNTIAWVLRIVISVLFVLSAITKMVTGEWEMAKSLWMFEKQLVDLGICGWCVAHYLARLLIGFELALGIAILFPHLLKKLVIPVTIALLVAFCIHLGIQMAEFGPFNGNCGCFGEAIPMKPIEAFIKNILTIGLLVWLFKLLPSKNESWKNIIYPVLIFLLCALFMFMRFPFCPCDKKVTQPPVIEDPVGTDSLIKEGVQSIDSLNKAISTDAGLSNTEKKRIQDSLDNAKKELEDEAKRIQKEKEEEAKRLKEEEAKRIKEASKGPKPIVSKFAAYPNFSGKNAKVDQGKVVICMFAPGCDHCQHTAQEIGKLAKTSNIPPVYIYFMDEETDKIPEFFKKAGVKYPYQVLGIGDFWDLLSEGSTPGVFLQHNGNTIKSYEGINENEFKIENLKEFATEK